jgi:hypothetical protein
MKKFFTLALVGALALGVSSVAYANFCAFDPAPAASLLFPFVAFDYNNPISGTTTLFAITNVSSEAQVVHITLWADYTFAVLDYNILLSGYDVVTQNIRDILYFGDLPNTGTADDLLVRQNDSPLADGPVNATTYGFPFLDDSEGTNTLQTPVNGSRRCQPSDLAYPNYPAIPQGILDQMQALLQTSQTASRVHGVCYSVTSPIVPDDWFQSRTTADVTWMYITADVVWNCNREFPDNDPTYWEFNCADPTYIRLRDVLGVDFGCNEAGKKRIENVLMGDVFWLNNDANFSEADHAVHLEADPFNFNVVTDTPDLGRTPISFFYRYSTNRGQSSDMREPLPTGWGFRYLGWNSDEIDTWIRAFKMASNVPEQHEALQNRVVDLTYDAANDTLIAWDCLAYTYFAWDEDEQVTFSQANPWSFPDQPDISPNLLPLETQEVNVDQFNFVDTNGWVMFLWPASNWNNNDPFGAWDNGSPLTDWYQTWMGVKYGAFGQYTAAMSGAVLANFNCFSDQVYPGLGLGYFYVNPFDGYKVSEGVYFD